MDIRSRWGPGVSARILTFTPISGRDVEIAWATHRAFKLAEAYDPSLLDDPVHRKARDKAVEQFERLYAQWCAK